MRMAAFKGQYSLLAIMLAKSPEQPLLDPEGRNLLHISACGESLKCLQHLESCGFDLEATDGQKRTCLHHAAAGASRPGAHVVIGYLLEQGLDPNQSDVDGWTPLLWAARSGNITHIRALLEAGAGSFYQGDKEWIPFAVASYHENTLAAAILRPSNRPLPESLQTQQSGISLRHPGVLCDGCDLVSRKSLCYHFPLLRLLTLSDYHRLPIQMLSMSGL